MRKKEGRRISTESTEISHTERRWWSRIRGRSVHIVWNRSSRGVSISIDSRYYWEILSRKSHKIPTMLSWVRAQNKGNSSTSPGWSWPFARMIVRKRRKWRCTNTFTNRAGYRAYYPRDRARESRPDLRGRDRGNRCEVSALTDRGKEWWWGYGEIFELEDSILLYLEIIWLEEGSYGTLFVSLPIKHFLHEKIFTPPFDGSKNIYGISICEHRLWIFQNTRWKLLLFCVAKRR